MESMINGLSDKKYEDMSNGWKGIIFILISIMLVCFVIFIFISEYFLLTSISVLKNEFLRELPITMFFICIGSWGSVRVFYATKVIQTLYTSFQGVSGHTYLLFRFNYQLDEIVDVKLKPVSRLQKTMNEFCTGGDMIEITFKDNRTLYISPNMSDFADLDEIKQYFFSAVNKKVPNNLNVG